MPIHKLAVLIVAFWIAASVSPARADDAQPGIVKSEFVYEKAPFPECHASTIVFTPGGLVAAWFGGTSEKHPDVGIWVSRHGNADGGEAWSKPVEVANGVQSATKRHPTWNPVLFQPKDGPLYLYYKVGPSPSTWWGMRMTSSDDGKTWSKPERLPDGQLGPVKNKPVQLASGTVLAGSSTEHNGWRLHIERSTDGGRSFTVVGPLNDGKAFGAIQPTLLEWPNNRVQILCRGTNGKVIESHSSDDGKTWSAATQIKLPNPNAGLDAVMLKDGRALLVYNHTPSGRDGPRGREMLNVAVRKDGQPYQAALVLERQKGEYSYPAVIQSPDGLVHIIYTYDRKKLKHVVVDPAKLAPRDFVDGNWPGK